LRQVKLKIIKIWWESSIRWRKNQIIWKFIFNSCLLRKIGRKLRSLLKDGLLFSTIGNLFLRASSRLKIKMKNLKISIFFNSHNILNGFSIKFLQVTSKALYWWLYLIHPLQVYWSILWSFHSIVASRHSITNKKYWY